MEKLSCTDSNPGFYGSLLQPQEMNYLKPATRFRNWTVFPFTSRNSCKSLSLNNICRSCVTVETPHLLLYLLVWLINFSVPASVHCTNLSVIHMTLASVHRTVVHVFQCTIDLQHLCPIVSGRLKCQFTNYTNTHCVLHRLTLIPLTWRIRWAHNNARK